MKKYLALVLGLRRRRRLIYGLGGAALVFSILGIFQVRITSDFSLFIPQFSEQSRLIQEMEQRFGDSNQLLLLVSSDGTGKDLRLLLDLKEALVGLEGVNRSFSPLDALTLAGDAVEVAAIDDLIEQLLGTTLLIPAQGDGGGFWVLFTLYMGGTVELDGVLDRVESTVKGYGRDYLLSGEPYLQGMVFSYTLEILLVLPPLAILLLLIVFRLRLGSTAATLITLVPALVGGVLTLGVLAWVNGTVSILSALIPVFVIVLGSADGLHVTNHYMAQRHKGRSAPMASALSLRAVGGSIIMTTITTMVGFWAMLLIDNPAMAELAVGASLGVFIAGAATWFLLPPLLWSIGPGTRQKVYGRVRPGQNRKEMGRLLPWAASLVLVGVSIPGALAITSDFSMTSVYKQNTEVMESIEQVATVLGASIPVMVNYPSDSPLDLDSAPGILALQQAASEAGLISSSASLPSLGRGLWQLQTGTDDLPRDGLAMAALSRTLTQNFPDLVDSFYRPSPDGAMARASFTLVSLDDEILTSFLGLSDEIAQEYDLDLEPVSTAFAMKEMNDSMVLQQLGTLALALAGVIVIASLFLRSMVMGLMSALPIVLTLVGLFGFLGWTGIEVSVVSGIMMGLTVGVGIDYSIHYMGMYRYLRKTRAAKEAAHQAQRAVAQPVIANALGLAIGFSVMALSPFRIHSILALLMALTMVLSSTLSLGLLPALLRASDSVPGERDGF